VYVAVERVYQRTAGLSVQLPQQFGRSEFFRAPLTQTFEVLVKRLVYGDTLPLT
jgi:hypothetical protein